MSENLPANSPPVQPAWQDDEIDLFELVEILWRRKVFILVVTAIASVAAVLYSLSLENSYKAKAQLLPPASSDSGKLSGMLGQLSSIPLLGLSGMGASKEDSFEVLKAYLLTEENVLQMIEEFELVQHWGEEFKFRESKLDAYKDAFSIEADKNSGIITVSFEDTDPELAAAIVNRNVELLESIGLNKVVSENRKKRLFLEERLEQATSDLNAAQKKIQNFKNQNGILSLESQAKASVEAAFRIQSEILLAQTRLKVHLELGSNENHPEIKVLRLEIEALEKQLQDIEKGRLMPRDSAAVTQDSTQAMTYIPLEELPGLEVEMERLMRRKTVAQEVFSVLTKEYEVSKIESAKDQELIQVIESAIPPERKSGPRRSVICIVAFLAASMLACFWVLIGHAIDERRKKAAA